MRQVGFSEAAAREFKFLSVFSVFCLRALCATSFGYGMDLISGVDDKV